MDIAVGVAVPVGVIALALLGFFFFRQRRKMAALENRLSRVEGGTQSQMLGSNTVSDVDYSQPAMVSLGFPSNPQTPSQIQEQVISQQQPVISQQQPVISQQQQQQPVISPQQQTSPDNRPLSWEHFKPVVQSQTNPVENENTPAPVPFTRRPVASIIKRSFSPQEME